MPAPVITVAQMREWEQASWSAGRVETDVIGRVGELVAKRARTMVRPGGRVLVLAGKGHNGDDARAAARHLPRECGVYVRNVTGAASEISEALAALEQRPALIIDGLFGIGLNRPLQDPWPGLIERINQLQTQVLSVDVPSGLNADTGEPEGAAIRATVTLTLGAPKRGLLLPAAWSHVGRLEVAADIGLAPCPHSSEMNWTLPEDFEDYPPARAATSHKGDFGHVAIIAGSLGYHGAAVLSARGAQRAQPGLITLHTPEAVYQIVASQLQAVMVSVWRPNQKWSGHYDAIMVGPGLAADNIPAVMRELVRDLWRHAPSPMVVDASALAWLEGVKPEQPDLVRVVTPHPGEAARILGGTAQQVQASRPDALRAVSERLGNCRVVLKGQQTLIGRSTGPILVNSSGNPHMAQGGAGDVLAGFLAGLLAQPAMQADPLKAISYGVWEHGAAADRLARARNNWVVEDLAAEIGNRETGGMG